MGATTNLSDWTQTGSLRVIEDWRTATTTTAADWRGITVTSTSGSWVSTTFVPSYFDAQFVGPRARGQSHTFFRVEACAIAVAREVDARDRVAARVQHLEEFYGVGREPRIAEGMRIDTESRAEAEERAKRLLLSCLTPEQRAMFEKHAGFRVVSNLGNVFELRSERIHNVRRLDAECRPIEEWCVTPNGRIPVHDVLLAQKVMLETDELGLRARANVWSLPSRQMVQWGEDQWKGLHSQPDYLRMGA